MKKQYRMASKPLLLFTAHTREREERTLRAIPNTRLRPQRRPLPLLRLRLDLRPNVTLVLHTRRVLLVELSNAVRFVLALEVLERGEVVAEGGLREGRGS
jgi:hypothetical protein